MESDSSSGHARDGRPRDGRSSSTRRRAAAPCASEGHPSALPATAVSGMPPNVALLHVGGITPDTHDGRANDGDDGGPEAGVQPCGYAAPDALGHMRLASSEWLTAIGGLLVFAATAALAWVAKKQMGDARRASAAEAAAIEKQIGASIQQGDAIREAARAQLQPVVFAHGDQLPPGTRRRIRPS